MDKKNGKIAHQRIVAGRRILQNLGRNNNSPATGRRYTQNMLDGFVQMRFRRQLIVRVTVVLCTMEPDVPFNVRVYVPTVACFDTVTVTVACAEFVPFNVT